MHQETPPLLPAEVLLDKNKICNLEIEENVLFQAVQRGERVVVNGRRNTGKTSLVCGVIAPRFQNANKNSIVVFVDFYGLVSIEDMEERLRIGLENGLSKAFPNQVKIKKLLESFKSLRPKIGVDVLSGEFNISLESQDSNKKATLHPIISEIKSLSQKYKILLIFDEFQDLYFVRSSLEKLRSSLQTLPENLPIIVLGSKKHLLSKIFARHKSPMASWGRDIAIPEVRSEHYQKAYLQYLNKFLRYVNCKMGKQVFDLLIEHTQGIPESINIVTNFIIRSCRKIDITEKKVIEALIGSVDERRSRFEEMFGRLRINERAALVAIAKYGPVLKIKSKDFLKYIPGIAPTSLFNAVRKLEDSAEIYFTQEVGYVIADPLFAIYMRRYK